MQGKLYRLAELGGHLGCQPQKDGRRDRYFEQ